MIEFLEMLPKIVLIIIGFSIFVAPKKSPFISVWLGVAVAEWAIKNYQEENFAWIIFTSLIAVFLIVLAVKAFFCDEY